MEFEGSKAWTEAVEMASAKRDVLWPVAGFFHLLPGVAVSFFFSDFQMAAMTDPQRAEKLLQGMAGSLGLVALLAFVLQMTGYMAMMKLLHDRDRPTVGEALRHALACLPAIVGAALLFYVALFVAALAFALVIGGLAAATGSAALGIVVVIAMIVAMLYAMTRLSLTMPAVVIEGKRNPILALGRSWTLTSGYALQLILFFFVLMLGYGVISLLVGAMFGAVIGMTVGMGTAGLLALGLISGAVGAVVAVLLTAILVAVHRQLTPQVSETISSTFD